MGHSLHRRPQKTTNEVLPSFDFKIVKLAIEEDLDAGNDQQKNEVAILEISFQSF
jgi:hypothetical protein